jgi:hypothetical protein
MLGKAIDRIEERLARHARGISIAAAIWFWFAVAVQARWIGLPDLPWLSEAGVLWAGVVFNAIWWGFLRPAIERRRKARAAAELPGAS